MTNTSPHWRQVKSKKGDSRSFAEMFVFFLGACLGMLLVASGRKGSPSGGEAGGHADSGIMSNLRIFLTATALLAAVLLVWAQLWPNMLDPRPYPAESEYPLGVALGLFWIYYALALALGALLWALLRSVVSRWESTPKTAIGLFFAALIIAGLNVLQSVVSILYKAFNEMRLLEPMDVPRAMLWVTIAFAIIVTSTSIACAYWRRMWIVEFVIILAFGIAGLVLVY